MKTRLMALLLVAGGSLLAETHVSIGVRIGGPPRYGYVAPAPPCPGPGYVWIDGYRDGYGRWYDGYWALPPYGGAYWVAPRFTGGRYYDGYWDGPRRFERREFREHRWRDYDRHERRDFDRGRHRGRGRDFDRDFRR
jgi:hypothetical protein